MAKQTEGIKSNWNALAERNWHAIQITVIVIAALAVYANSLDVQFVMDDEAIFEIGPRKLLEILHHGGPRRIADLTLALNFQLHGQSVTGYHLVNLAVHLFSSLIVYCLTVSSMTALRQSFPSTSGDEATFQFVERFVPFSTALLFAVHPVQTQAVTYIIQRYTSMATLFYLLSAYFYIRTRLVSESNPFSSRTLLLGGAAVASGIMAAGSKQIAFTLPVMLFMIEVFLFRGRLIQRRFSILAWSLGLTALSLALLNWHDSSLKDILFDLHHGTSEDSHASRASYLITQFRVVATYLRLLCLPVNQSIFYDYPLYKNLFSVQVAAALALHICLLALMAFLLRQSNQNMQSGAPLKGIPQRLVSLGIAWFYIAMLVESSIFPIRDVIFEHRVYLPSFGFFLAGTAGIAAAAGTSRAGIKAAWSLLIVSTMLLGAMTIARNRVWGDNLRLWQDTVRKAPGKYLALSNLAVEYLERGMPDKALPLFVRAIELKPDLDFHTKVYLGEALQEMYPDERWRSTTGKEFLRSDGTVSNFRATSVMFNNLGLAYEHLGESVKASDSYIKALRLNPGYDLAWYNLGTLSIMRGDRGQAATALLRLNQLNPTLAAKLSKTMPD